MKEKTMNARVTRTMLGFEDHGILTALVDVTFADGGQGFGGLFLDNANLAWFVKASSRRWVSTSGEASRASRVELGAPP